MAWRGRRLPGFVLLVLTLACTHAAQPAPGPTEARLLSTGSPTRDEDPTVIRARDGRMLVAWFSDRGGNPGDIYLTSTTDGASWSGPVRVTTNGGGDFYPNLLQDSRGTFHLVWFRWSAPLVGNIWHNTSADGVTWDPASEEQVTKAFSVDDWVPTLAEAPDGSLLVYLVSAKRDTSIHNNQIYLARKPPAANAWDPVVVVPGINSATAHDHLPVAARTGDQVTMVWVRYDTAQSLPWLAPKSDLVYATTGDGLSWSAPAQITQDAGDVVNLYPALYPDLQDGWWLVWLSTRSGAPAVYRLPLAGAAQYPSGVAAMDQLPAGYSHRIAATAVAGLYLGVWVQGPEGSQDIYYRFFQ